MQIFSKIFFLKNFSILFIGVEDRKPLHSRGRAAGGRSPTVKELRSFSLPQSFTSKPVENMTFPEFSKKNKLDKTVNLQGSAHKTYEKDPEMPIQFVHLSKCIPGTDQDWLVLSYGLAKAIKDGELTLRDAVVAQNEDELYGLIRPASGILIATVDLW